MGDTYAPGKNKGLPNSDATLTRLVANEQPALLDGLHSPHLGDHIASLLPCC
jgi:hypothetical protein